MKRCFIISIFAVLCSFGTVHSQEKLNEFMVSKDENHKSDINYTDFGAADSNGVVIINTMIPNVTFALRSVRKDRLRVVPDPIRNRYLLIIKPNDYKYGQYKITLTAPGFKQGEIANVVVKEKLSSAYDVNPKYELKNNIDFSAKITVYGKDGKPLEGAKLANRETGKSERTNSDGVGTIRFERKGLTANITVSHFRYSDTKNIVVRDSDNQKVTLSNYIPPTPPNQQKEENKFRLFVPFAIPMGNLGNGSDNWITSGNAWSNSPFNLAYFFEDNKALSKAARNMGFGIGAKAIIPLKKSTTAIIVQAEYLLMLSNSGKLSSSQSVPADVYYYQYNPSSGLNNVKVLETNINFTFPRLNTTDVMLGVNKKFRNIIGSSHLEVEGAAGAAWHWCSDFTGQSTTSGEYNFDANYDIFSRKPSPAFEVGVTLTLGSHLSLGLNYVYLGGFDVKGHASWNSTVIPPNDANINNVDFNFGHVTVHYLGLVLNYSTQN